MFLGLESGLAAAVGHAAVGGVGCELSGGGELDGGGRLNRLTGRGADFAQQRFRPSQALLARHALAVQQQRDERQDLVHLLLPQRHHALVQLSEWVRCDGCDVLWVVWRACC